MDRSKEIYQRFLDGDEDALCELLDEYKDGLTFYINSIVGNLTVAEEVMLDTFTKLTVKQPRFNGDSEFKTWLYAIGRNLAIDTVKKSRKDVPLDDIIGMIDEAEALEDFYLRDEKKSELRRAVSRLKSEHSQALRLVYFDGFTNTEAARIMKKTRHQFDSLIYRAKNALKNELERMGIRYDEF